MSDEQDGQMEVLQPSALHALERAQIDVQVATAHQYPRSIEKFKARALSMATLDEETAESCIYIRPVGREFDKATGQWHEKFAEGASIRLAEIVGCSYGNLRVASRIVEQTPRYVKCEGVCHDLESNYAGKSEIVESTVNKEGVPYSERQRALTAKVALAKAYRDAIFKVVPRALCKPVMDAAKKTATGDSKPLEERRKKAQAWISTLKISEARVFAVLGVNGWADVSNEHLLTLTGLKTAISDGDRIDDIFPALESQGTKGPEIPGKTPAKDKKESEKKPSTPPQSTVEPPKTETAQQKTENSTKEQASSVNPDEKTEAALGLAPEQKPETPPQTQAQTFEPDPKLAPKPGDSDALASVKMLAAKSGITHAQLMGWAVSAKMAKDGQSISDLAEGKLVSIGGKWSTVLGKIRGQQTVSV